MHLRFLRWLATNLGSLILAFLLAVTVWISAVVTADPNIEQTLRPVDIEIVGQDPDLLLVGDIPGQVRLTLKAPSSIWEQLNNNPSLAKAWIDLTGLEPGEHTVDVKVSIDASPIRYVHLDPQQVSLILEPLLKQEYPVQLTVSGELPLGYRKGAPALSPHMVSVSGPQSLVQRVAQANILLDISGATETINKFIAVSVVDTNGNLVPDLVVVPKTISVTQPINLLGGFKNVAVKVATTGQVSNGYRLTNISVSPPTVTLFSDNPQLMNEVPGFVETLPVDLTNLQDDEEISVGLNLPQGITSVREPDVLVQISVAAIEGSLTLSVPLQVIGLGPDLLANVSPEMVDVIVAGPLNILDALEPSDFRVYLDLSGLPSGVYQRTPEVEVSPGQVRVQTTLPETVEVVIELAPTPTPTQITTPLVTPSGTPGP